MAKESQVIALPRGRVLRVPAGSTLVAHAGAIWITEQDNPHDVVLRPGETYRLVRRGLALVEAFSDAAISLEQR